MQRKTALIGGLVILSAVGAVSFMKFRRPSTSPISSGSVREALADRSHFQAVTALQQGSLVRVTLGVSPNGSEKDLRACLEGKGKKCQRFHRDNLQTFLDVEGVMNARVQLKDARVCPNGASADCPIERETGYRVVCSSDKACEKVELVLQTRLYDEAGGLVLNRKSPVHLSAADLVKEGPAGHVRGPFSPRRPVRFIATPPPDAKGR